MTWGGTYSGLQHFAVTVIQLQPVTPSLPAAPSNLAATAVSSSEIELSWQDKSDNENWFEIEKKTGAGGTCRRVARVGTNVTSYSNTRLNADTTYYYRVTAYNSVGNSEYSNEAGATTLPPLPPKPALKSLAKEAVVGSLTPRLEWYASTGAQDYGLQVATDSGFTNLVVDESGIAELYYDVPDGLLNLEHQILLAGKCPEQFWEHISLVEVMVFQDGGRTVKLGNNHWYQQLWLHK